MIIHWILYKDKHFGFLLYLGVSSHDHQNGPLSNFFEILAIFKVNYWVRRTFSHDMTLYTVLFTLCSNKINKEKIVVLQLVPILFDQISPKWVQFRWWLQVLESKLPQTWSYNILFFHKFCVDLKFWNLNTINKYL